MVLCSGPITCIHKFGTVLPYPPFTYSFVILLNSQSTVWGFLQYFIVSLCYSVPFSGHLQIQTLSVPEYPVWLQYCLHLPLSFSEVIYARTFFFSSLKATLVIQRLNFGESKWVIATRFPVLTVTSSCKEARRLWCMISLYNGHFYFFPTYYTNLYIHSFCFNAVCANLPATDVRHWSDKFLVPPYEAHSNTWN